MNKNAVKTRTLQDKIWLLGIFMVIRPFCSIPIFIVLMIL